MGYLPGAAAVLTAIMAIGSTVASPTASASPACTSDSLALSTGAPGSPGDATQIHFELIVTNISPQLCELNGYPGVDLIGPDDPMWGPDYQLPQQADAAVPITLAPGASASSRLTFLAEPNGWVPDTIAVTLPNAPGRMEVPWIAGRVPVARQDAASHPGTYVGPLHAVASDE
ncbi:DUF4232 domain-containing protein [Mycolicibacterium sp. ELW1]|uniref:DUF4232 domain-containing protein n=1 Tax=Mycobacteriaceae TaxID=1762 RepID=UPI0011EC1A34|nr:DUF4232 domain-containing protein [Mycobacterium sp. ELW1]QEN14051.1 DUF4232 domain-containing protein [Mycobacterium sp. ELW1]